MRTTMGKMALDMINPFETEQCLPFTTFLPNGLSFLHIGPFRCRGLLQTITRWGLAAVQANTVFKIEYQLGLPAIDLNLHRKPILKFQEPFLVLLKSGFKLPDIHIPGRNDPEQGLYILRFGNGVG